MSEFDDENILEWARPMSDDDRARAAAAVTWVAETVSEALGSVDTGWDPAIFEYALQGSAANDTSVGTEGDVDVSVTWCGKLLQPSELDPRSYGLTAARWTYSELVEFLDYTFGEGGAFAFRTDDFALAPVDVVPAIRILDGPCAGFSIPGGINGYLGEIENWPGLHRAAIDIKDSAVDHALRPLVRVLKGIRNLQETATGSASALPSFLLESLAVAAPDDLYANSVEVTLELVLSWAIKTVKDPAAAAEVRTPDGRNLLFGPHQKWSANQLNNPLVGLSHVIDNRNGFGTA